MSNINQLKFNKMKKVFLLFVLLISTISFGQIQKIETPKALKETRVSPMGVFWASATFYEDGVLVSFRDANYSKITVLRSFKLSTDDFNSLGKILTGDENKVDDFYVIKTLDSKELYFKFGKSFGVLSATILLNGDSVKDALFPYLTKKQFKKLFDISE